MLLRAALLLRAPHVCARNFAPVRIPASVGSGSSHEFILDFSNFLAVPTGSSSGSTSEANARRGKATKGQRRWNSNFVAGPPWFQVRSLSIVSIVPSTAASFRAPFSLHCLSVPEPALFVASLALACRSLMCVARLYPRCTVFRSRSPLCIAVPDTSVAGTRLPCERRGA